jgi:hypothetical protein
VGSIPIARSNDPLGPTAKICPLAQASKMSPDGVRRGQWGPVMWQRKLLDTPLACKLMTRSSRWSKTHLGTGDKRDPDRTWEVKAIRTVRHKISRMPVEQIAHTLFVSRLEPLATMLEDLGWHSPYKARHYFISLAMQTPVPKRPRILSIERWIAPAATIGKVIDAYALRLASSDQNAWLASRVFHDRVLNPRFIDMEQVQEICREFFAQMSASENDLGLPLKIVMDVFDHFEKVIERQRRRSAKSARPCSG